MVYLLSSIISDLTKGLIFFSLFFSPLSTNLNFKPLYKVGKPPTKAWFMQMPSDPLPGACDPVIVDHNSGKKLHSSSLFMEPTVLNSYAHLFSCNYHLQVGQGLKISSVHLGP